jgi:hypothetical protein
MSCVFVRFVQLVRKPVMLVTLPVAPTVEGGVIPTAVNAKGAVTALRSAIVTVVLFPVCDSVRFVSTV